MMLMHSSSPSSASSADTHTTTTRATTTYTLLKRILRWTFFVAVMFASFFREQSWTKGVISEITESIDRNSISVNRTTTAQEAQVNHNNNSNYNPQSQQKQQSQRSQHLQSQKTASSTNEINNLFLGSRHSLLSPGMDMYENVCIEYKKTGLPQEQQKGGQKYVKLKAYTVHETGLRATFQARGNEKFMQTFYGYPLQQWEQDIAKATTILFEKETLWTHTMYNNPGHCINDVAFLLGLDYYYRGQYLHDSNNNQKPIYQQWLASQYRFFLADAPHSWCAALMTTAHFIEPSAFVSFPSSPNMGCFRKLIVPAIPLVRAPKFRKIGDNSTMQQKPLDYPPEAIMLLREKLQIALNLTTSSWPNDSLVSPPASTTTLITNATTTTTTTTIIATDNNKTILLHIRGRTQRRKLVEAAELKSHLEFVYHAKVEVLSDDWIPLNFQEQAKVYNSYEYILTGHGAHQANLIFCRPNTKLVEFGCAKNWEEKRPISNATERTPGMSDKDWYGLSDITWFYHWSRNVGIEHFMSPRHCKNNNDDIRLDWNRDIPLIVTRFGLQPRHHNNNSTTDNNNNNNNNSK